MSKLFTDEDGNKFELVGEYANPGIVIKPVTEKLKYWSIWFQPDGEDRVSLLTEKLTTKQASAVLGALEAFARYIYAPDDKRGGSPATGSVNDAMREARHVLASRPEQEHS